VSLEDNKVSNGDFSTNVASWDSGYGAKIESVYGGQNGNALQLTGEEYGSQITWQNIKLDAGKFYEIEGYVKSGTSGDEQFAIHVNGHSGSLPEVYSIQGRTTGSWIRHFGRFQANHRKLSVILRKNSATIGTMLFDRILVRRVSSDNTTVAIDENFNNAISHNNGNGDVNSFRPYGSSQRFRENPELFKEIITLEKYAVFEVKK